MSYSVGQTDEEEPAQGGVIQPQTSGPGLYGSSHYGSQYPLARYPSRPSNELLRGSSGLGQLQEDEREIRGDAPGQSRATNVFDSAAKSLADSIRGELLYMTLASLK
jgi:hypothetical protein